MKEGWEYKKLGEICEIKAGYTPKSEEISYIGDIPYFKVGDMNSEGNETYLHKTDSYLSKDVKYFPKNSIVFPKNGAAIATNKKRILSQPSVVDLNTAILIPNVTQSVKFLFYFLNNIDFKDITRGGAVPTLDLKELKLYKIPNLTLEEQKRIVEELDLLSGIIEKQKQQLKELDTLAQSIFYDMFGDPVANEKGWEIKKLKDVSTLYNGRAYKQNELLKAGKYKVLRVGNFFTNNEFYYSNLELESEKYCNRGDLLFAWSASFGAFIWKGIKVIYHYHIWKVEFNRNLLNIHFYRFLLNTMTSYFMKDVHGIGMVHLTKSGMEQYKLPIPPLPLQNLFASKIEAIEKQKEAITKSIEETQKLFDYTMDKYFG